MERFDITIIGAGPGGYVAAIRAAQLGLKVALVEKDARLGGTCLNVGCIPTKAMLESSHLFAQARDDFADHGIDVGQPSVELGTLLARKERVVTELTDGVAFLMKRNKITVLSGQGRLLAADRVSVQDASGSTEEHETKAVLLATGSQPTSLPHLPVDGDRIVTSTEALSLSPVPASLLVVGGGAIGLELGSVWRRLGAEVTVVELMPQLVPFADKSAASALGRALKKQGITLRLRTKVTAVSVTDDGVTVSLEDARERAETVTVERVLVAVGRQPHSAGLGLDAVGVKRDERGRVEIDDRYETSRPGVYAIGDLVQGPMLAHKASEEGMAAVEVIAGQPARRIDPLLVPSVVYTWPELAQVGLTEAQAKEAGHAVRSGQVFFKANGRAKTAGHEEGLVKVVADKDSGALLGVHIVGPHASELIAEAATALTLGATAAALGQAVHAHPTLAESLKDAALAAAGLAVH